MSMRAVFDRIGRYHNVPSLDLPEGGDADELAVHVHNHARPYLMSRDVEVLVNLDERKGLIVVGGFRNGGSFTLERTGRGDA